MDDKEKKTDLPFSLDHLAKSHLGDVGSQTPGGFQIPNLFAGQSSSAMAPPGFAVSAGVQIPNIFEKKEIASPASGFQIPDLFSNNKENQGSRNAKQPDFQIPDIFGKPSADVKAKNDLPMLDPSSIDLMSALRLDSLPTTSEDPLKKVVPLMPKTKSSKDELIDQLETLNLRSNDGVECSAFGHVLCRDWTDDNRPRRKRVKVKSPILPSDIVPFKFDTPSPDDIVMKAQSRVFTRPS